MNRMKLLSVRLGAEEARAVDYLRRHGVEISSLVREAIRVEYDRRRAQKGNGRTPSEIVAEIIARYPTPPGYKPRGYNVHNAKEARAAIPKKLRRRPT